jgi:5-methylcytosine-specific restriction enzyme A
MPSINLKTKANDKVHALSKALFQGIYQDKRWKGLRTLKLRNNPICEDCFKKGIYKQTEEVHHIIPWERGKDKEEQELLAFDYNNLKSLCLECHKEAHRELNKKI